MSNTERLIQKVREYAFLYDNSHDDYKNLPKKAETWRAIASELDMSCEAAAKKWKNLRDSYLRFKKSVIGVTGHAKKYHSWPWSGHMRFLDDSLRPRSPISCVPGVENEYYTSLDKDSSEPIDEAEESETRVAPSSPQTSPLPPPPKKKKVESGNYNDPSQIDPIEKVINYLQNRTSDRQLDGIDHLFLSYAETFRKFQPTTQAMMKVELATLFAKAEMKELGNPNIE